MNRFRWLFLLMGLAIAGITGFQLYWLRQNYAREKHTLTLKADIAFRETIMQLQVAKLKLDGVEWNGKMVIHDAENGPVTMRIKPKEEVISTINVIRNKLKDSLKVKTDIRSGVVIAMNKEGVSFRHDSVHFQNALPAPPGKTDRIFNLLYGVDSLQDSLRLAEIDSALHKRFKEDKLSIPFSIIKKDSVAPENEAALNQVTVGFAHPVSYRLQLGNTFPYLLRQIAQPIFFSVLLLGITLLSFVLLYRNLVKQRRLAALKNEFISNITHELKTPIATVGVAVEALKNFNAIQDPARTREYLDISANELQRLNLLVDKVLKLSMFEKKEVEMKFEPLCLEDIVQEVTGSLKLQLEKNHARVSIRTHGDTTLMGDRLHLLSVVFNLLDNALKYSKEEPVIQIDLEGNDEEVILTVADNGIGIPEAYQEKIFDKFFRVPHGDTHNAKGYGLGLSYVAKVLQKHGGRISIRSREGEGTRFIIHLPKKTA